MTFGSCFEIERKHVVREWCVHIHHVADHQRCAFVTAQHAGRKGPGGLQLTDVRGIDLLERRETLRVIRSGRHDPIFGIFRHFDESIIGIGGSCGECRNRANGAEFEQQITHRMSSLRRLGDAPMRTSPTQAWPLGANPCLGTDFRQRVTASASREEIFFSRESLTYEGFRQPSLTNWRP